MRTTTPTLLISLAAALVAAGIAACSGGATTGGATTGGTTTGAGGSVEVPPDAMCDVLAILRQQCWSCHGTTLHGNAPISLVTLADLKAPSKAQPGKSYAERSVLRMATAASPMPPGKSLTSTPAEVALFKAWIEAGYPEASCGDLAQDPYEVAPTCTGEQLGPNQEEGEEMHPGRVCNTCHEQVNAEQGGDAPLYLISGTIFPTAHETDDCRTPSAAGAQVEITDAKGKVVVLEANAAGNFVHEEVDLEFPYTARVLFEGRVRAMALPQDKGSCNECHTEAGASDAPGRILLP